MADSIGIGMKVLTGRIMEEYPMYHCQECGYYFRDIKGTEQEGLRGQQSEVIPIVCESCGRDGSDEEAT